MCIRDSYRAMHRKVLEKVPYIRNSNNFVFDNQMVAQIFYPVSYTHLRAHETVLDLVCRLLLEKKNITSVK